MQTEITGSFLDGIACDIPSNNWTLDVWRRQFENMKSIGMDTLILIRVGWKDSAMYRSEAMHTTLYEEPDLLEFFFGEADRLGFQIYQGLYDTSRFWLLNDWEHEVDINRKVMDEIQTRYGRHASFAGWYMSHEGDMRFHPEKIWKPLIRHAKELDPRRKILISPRYAGVKYGEPGMTPAIHRGHFRYLFDFMEGLIDFAAFMDGHVEFRELEEYMSVTAEVCREFGIEFWSNLETFDRDMPWHFPPIEWIKMRHKLELAGKYARKIVTFEAPHFLSPYSMFPSAHGLYDRYLEYIRRKESEE